MLYFNADGKPGSMCGNGGRCAIAFAKELGLIKTKTQFLAYDGAHEGAIDNKGEVTIKMSDVNPSIHRLPSKSVISNTR